MGRTEKEKDSAVLICVSNFRFSRERDRETETQRERGSKGKEGTRRRQLCPQAAHLPVSTWAQATSK